jgi:hypothetical protein
MEFKILGPLEVRAGEQDVTCKGAKQRLLLSVLLLNANEVVSSDRLIDLLWGDDPPETTKALQMHVSQLRKQLEPGLLLTRPPGYELRVAPRDADLLLGRLAAARRDEPFREPRVRLAQEAVDMARRIGDPATIAYALEAHWPAVEGPATLDGRLERADELISLGLGTGNLEQAFAGHDYRLNTFITLADRAGIDVCMAALAELADTLRQPAQRWSVSTSQTMVALLEGRFEQAEALIDQTRALGERAYSWNADVSYRVQIFLLRRAQGRLAEVEHVIEQAVHRYPALHRFSCVSAHLQAELGHERAAREAFDRAVAHMTCGTSTSTRSGCSR